MRNQCYLEKTTIVQRTRDQLYIEECGEERKKIMVCSGKWPSDGAITPQSGANTTLITSFGGHETAKEKFGNPVPWIFTNYLHIHELSKASAGTSKLNIPTMQ